MAAGLLNMTVDMVMKMNETSAQQDMENMTSMSHGLSTSIEETQGNNAVKNLVNYETSLELAKSLKILFSNYLQDAKLENSTGLMPIPTEIKINAIRELGRGIDNLVLALNRGASIEEVYNCPWTNSSPSVFSFQSQVKL